MPKRERRLYPTNYATDLTDAQWAAIAPLVTITSPKCGRPTDINLRAIVNMLLYKNRTGCQRHLLPNDVPPMSSVRYYFDTWNRDGTLDLIKIYFDFWNAFCVSVEFGSYAARNMFS